MNAQEAQRLLNQNGFPCGAADGIVGQMTSAALKRFQEAFHNGPDLVLSGRLDDPTRAALAKLPWLSPHFQVSELRSAGDGHCYVRRELLGALEQLRAAANRPIPLRSAYRDPSHNSEVGGAAHSMHMFGLAADLPASLGFTVDWVHSLRLFSGIGDQGGIVLHVDCRHRAGSNNATPGATPSSPARWHY